MISKRDPVKGFIVTVVCWCASAITLLNVIGVIAGQDLTVQPQQTLRYTQNFFYGTFAAGLYLVIAVFLAAYAGNVHSVHLTHEERRTIECTSIILRVTAFGAFLLGGAAVYTVIEGWSFMDALYWADFTLLTVGIGNIAPKTHLGRSLLFPYVSAGLMNAGLVISAISSFTESMRELGIRLKIAELHSDMQSREHINRPTGNSADISRLQRIKHDFYRRHRRMTLIFSGIAWFFLWLVSAAIFGRSERSQDWSYFASLYFTFTSLTTIGYGDLYPISNFGKAFFVFWSLLAIPVLTNLVAAMAQSGFEGLKPSRLLHQHTQSRMDSSAPGQREKGSSLSGPHASSHVSGPTEARETYSSGPSGSATYEERESCELLMQAAQRSLSLGEETSKLIAVLQSPSTTHLDLSKSKEDDVLEAAFITSPYRHTTMAELLDSNMSAMDRSKEILWMLRYLVDMICSDLREAEGSSREGRSP
ncbi:hypothetical protein BJX96DRAFT_168223 [Aspergillus floccosus]